MAFFKVLEHGMQLPLQSQFYVINLIHWTSKILKTKSLNLFS